MPAWEEYQPGKSFDRLGIKVPCDAPTWHSIVTYDMCVPLIDPLIDPLLTETPPFWPEIRLRWFAEFFPWMANLHAIPYIQIENAPQLRLLHACTRVQPIFWAWTSTDQGLIQIGQLNLYESLWVQLQLFQTLFLEFKHILAQDWFH